MNDATKAAVKRVRSVLAQESFDAGDFEGTDLAAILAHVDGEPARLAARAEEVREACARFLGTTMEQADDLERDDVDMVDAVLATPLDATPLGDELKSVGLELEAARALYSDPGGEAMSTVCYCGRPDCSVTSMARDACLTTLRAERDEAVAALRALLREEWYIYEGNLEAAGHASVDDLNAARAVLAKHPEGK